MRRLTDSQLRLDRAIDPGIVPRLRPPEWTEDAACLSVGYVWFFPDKPGCHTLQTGKTVCQRCPVIAQCLVWGLQVDRDNGGDRYGVYGGLTPEERYERYGRAAETGSEAA